MNIDSFSKFYHNTSELVKIESDYYQDLSLKFYGHTARAGFGFGVNGLEEIIMSYTFKATNKILFNRLSKKDILNISRQILNKITQNYGECIFDNPWDGTMFMYMWETNGTLIQFAWDGGDSWGIQYRSINLDPQAKAFIEQF